MKVSLYIDDDVWKKFKRRVLLKSGELRGLGSEVQDLMKADSPEESLLRGFKGMKLEVKPISYSEVVPVKPSVRTSSSKTIRKMRDRRSNL